MNTSSRKAISPSALALVLAASAVPIAATTTVGIECASPQSAYAAQNAGWRQYGGDWWYAHEGSGWATGWEKIGGTWYLFDSSGWMLTGWQKVGETWYYLQSNGARATGWQRVNGPWYCLKSSGAMATGWQKVGGTWYYLKTDGAMATGWQKLGETWYWFDKSGAMKTGWQYIGYKWYYLAGSGAMQSSKWIGDYYVQADGSMATRQWIGKYYVDNEGLYLRDATYTLESPSDFDYWTVQLDESQPGIQITGIKRFCHDVVIPESIDGLPVVSVILNPFEYEESAVNIDASQASELKEFFTSADSIKSVNLSGLDHLVSLALCSPLTADFKLPKLPALQTLTMQVTQPTTLDINGFPSLESVSIGWNYGLKAVTLSDLPSLQVATIDYNDTLESLTLHNVPNLAELYCPSNALQALDISEAPSLKYLDCSDNRIKDTSALSTWIKQEGHSGKIFPQVGL